MLLNNAVCLSYLLIKLVNDLLDTASYYEHLWDHSSKIKGEKFSIWLRKAFTESYWQMTKCLCECCDLGTCQHYDHIRMADWKTKRLQRRCYLVRKQFKDFLWMNLWSPIPCYLSQGFVFVLSKNYTSFFLAYTVLPQNKNIQQFRRRKT